MLYFVGGVLVGYGFRGAIGHLLAKYGPAVQAKYQPYHNALKKILGF